MPKKNKTVFVCQECGLESPKWLGQCSVCGAWNSFLEEKVTDPLVEDPRRRTAGGSKKEHGGESQARAVSINSISSGQSERLDTGIGELNRVLGGGLVKGSLTLISGEPGIGKSTIIIQAAASIAAEYGKVLYISGEESAEQIKMRADRVCGNSPDSLFLLSQTNMEEVMDAVSSLQPIFLVIDSIQTMYTPDYESAPGSVSQVRACCNLLMNLGKGLDIPVFIVAHVTKSGELAGPRVLEHMVDCVLSFNGERSSDLRILRAVKNRFGTTSEIGAFEMCEEGLVEIQNPSESFLGGLEDCGQGTVATAVCEGTRPLLLEIQALTSATNVGFARRTAIGYDGQRLAMIVAVLEKKAGITLINRDIFVNVAGGLKPEGTSSDLAVALAIWSDEKNVPLSHRLLVMGEIGLGGDIRPVRNAEKLVKEAARMGFERVILPKRSADKIIQLSSGKSLGIELFGVKTVREAIDAAGKP